MEQRSYIAAVIACSFFANQVMAEIVTESKQKTIIEPELVDQFLNAFKDPSPDYIQIYAALGIAVISTMYLLSM